MLNRLVVDRLGVDVRTPAKVVRLTLHERPRPLGIRHHRLRRRDDLLLGSVALGLAEVDMNKLEPRVDARLGCLHARRVIQIQIHLDAILLGFGDQCPKVCQGPELRMHGRMSAGRRPNGPGTPWIVRGSHGGIVLPLAVHLPNGMNRREVEYVKAHVRDIGQARCTVLEGTVLAWHRGAGAWEHFVPGAEAGLVAIHHHRELARVGRSKAAVGVRGHQSEQGLVLKHQLRPFSTS